VERVDEKLNLYTPLIKHKPLSSYSI